MQSSNNKKPMIVSIDTEPDDMWSNVDSTTVENLSALPRFDRLCERYGVVPTYLITHEVMEDETFIGWSKERFTNGKLEIGLHFHPLQPRQAQDFSVWPSSHAMHYKPEVLAKNVKYLTEKMESVYGKKIRSHRAGRWGLNTRLAQALIDNGYEVDLSVTPGMSWIGAAGLGDGAAADYTGYPHQIYQMDRNALDRHGSSGLWEIPVSIIQAHKLKNYDKNGNYVKWIRKVWRKENIWLRPNGRNRYGMIALLDKIAEDPDYTHASFMLHSSEMMEGCNPTFKTKEDIDGLFSDIELVFAYARDRFEGISASKAVEKIRSAPKLRFDGA